MKKYPKWKLNIQSQNYFTIEIEAESETKAAELAIREIQRNPSYYDTGGTTLVTGIFINDRHAREFSPYVPECLPKNDLLPDSTESV